MQVAFDTLLVWKSAAVAAWFALFFLAERVHAAAMPRAVAAPWHRLGRNMLLWAANAVMSPLLVLPLSALAAAHSLDWRPLWWRGAGGLAVELLLLDMLIYWWHRASHVVPFLWRFHSVHHRDRFLDATTALRFHPGEVLLSAAARALVIIVLAMPLASVLVFEGLVLLATIFHHSNLKLPPRLERCLSWLVVTPSIHWVHHHRLRRDTDANYSTVLSLWDRLFTSRSPTRRSPDMTIGMEGGEELPLGELLLSPFR